MNKYMKFGAIALVGYFVFSRYIVSKTAGTGTATKISSQPVNAMPVVWKVADETNFRPFELPT